MPHASQIVVTNAQLQKLIAKTIARLAGMLVVITVSNKNPLRSTLVDAANLELRQRTIIRNRINRTIFALPYMHGYTSFHRISDVETR